MHTPGPWTYDGKWQICIPHEKGVTCFRTNVEDACLIAAAPEMYELLKDLYIPGNTCKANLAISALLNKIEGR